MKYENTSDTNIKRNPTSKIYYFVRGSIEHSLKTKEWTKAVWRKRLKESELDASGEVALKFTVAQVYEDYIAARRQQVVGKNKKVKKIRPGTLKEIEYIFAVHLLPFFGKKIEHTDMQKEKFADASMDVQKNIYVSMDHEDLRGLENSVKLPTLEKIIAGKGLGSGKQAGNK